MLKGLTINRFKIIMCITAVLFSATTVYAKSGSWGLSYPVPGSTPRGEETIEHLKELDAYYVGSGEEKTIYLTFDAGFENGYTETVLDTLKKNKVPAAFFLVGTYIRDNPDLVNRMVKEGHIIANHTMSHPDMPALSEKAAFAKELSQVEELYKSTVGEDIPKYYRPPQGKYSDANMQMAKDLGYKTIFWSVAYHDWDVNNQPSREEAFSKLMPRIHPGAVILLHNTSKTNAAILEELITRCRDMGYEFKSLDEL